MLSGGRAQLGIGAAWYEREHRALGVPFPPLAERFRRLEETLQICLQMWSDDNGPYHGTHHQLGDAQRGVVSHGGDEPVQVVEVMPVGDPITYTHHLIDRIVPALAELGP